MRKYIFVATAILYAFVAQSQSLSGLWEGTYAHFYPGCCNEVQYKCKFRIYDDGKGSFWAESELSATSDDFATGLFVTQGKRMPDGRIFFKDGKLIFSTLILSKGCFYKCSWCNKQYMLVYKKSSKTETLSGLWNSWACYPGGEITLTRVADLLDGQKLEIIQKTTNEKLSANYLYADKEHISLKRGEDNKVLIYFARKYFEISADNADDIVARQNQMTYSKITTIIYKNQMQVAAFEMHDPVSGKTYKLNPFNLNNNEMQDNQISPYGLTFPTRTDWAEILKRSNSIAESETTNKENRKTEIKAEIEVSNKDDVYLQVWDNNVEDGDVVSIFLNNLCILENYTLTSNKKEIKLPIAKGENILLMFAENLGNIPPNTASMSITSEGKSVKTMVLESDFKNSGAIKIIAQ